MSDFEREMAEQGHDASCNLRDSLPGFQGCTCNKRRHDRVLARMQTERDAALKSSSERVKKLERVLRQRTEAACLHGCKPEHTSGCKSAREALEAGKER